MVRLRSVILSAKPSTTPNRGLIMSATSEDTTLEIAVPNIKPTANPTTPCSLMKLKNPFKLNHPL